jgi:hypothetical protein
MSSLTGSSEHRRSPSSAWLGLAGSHPTPARVTPPRDRRRSGAAGFGPVVALSDTSGPVVVLPDSWHVPGRHEHGRPLLPRGGGLAFSRSWS